MSSRLLPSTNTKRLCALWTCAALACLDNVTRRRLLLRGSERLSVTDEETRVDLCTALGGVASRSAARYVAESTTVERSERPDRTDRSPNDWRFLHRGNDRDVLQRDHRAEHEWLRVAPGVHIEPWGR